MRGEVHGIPRADRLVTWSEGTLEGAVGSYAALEPMPGQCGPNSPTKLAFVLFPVSLEILGRGISFDSSLLV